jgi:hypothetical protein
MHGDQPHPVAQVEPQRVDVVVGRDEPHPPAPGRTGDRHDRLQQRGTDAAAPYGGVDRHHLAGVAGNVVGQQAHHVAAQLGDETGQSARVVHATARDDQGSAPRRREDAGGGGCVAWLGGPYDDGHVSRW